MQDGELVGEPELHLDAKGSTQGKITKTKTNTDWASQSERESRKKTKGKLEEPAGTLESGDVENDEFFGSDDDEEGDNAGHDREGGEDEDEDDSE